MLILRAFPPHGHLKMLSYSLHYIDYVLKVVCVYKFSQVYMRLTQIFDMCTSETLSVSNTIVVRLEYENVSKSVLKSTQKYLSTFEYRGLSMSKILEYF